MCHTHTLKCHLQSPLLLKVIAGLNTFSTKILQVQKKFEIAFTRSSSTWSMSRKSSNRICLHLRSLTWWKPSLASSTVNIFAFAKLGIIPSNTGIWYFGLLITLFRSLESTHTYLQLAWLYYSDYVTDPSSRLYLVVLLVLVDVVPCF